MDIDCLFLEPVEIASSTFQFSRAVCSTTDARFELIQNEGTSTEFFLSKTISYADFLIIIFLLLFLIGGVAKFIIKWFIPDKLELKK